MNSQPERFGGFTLIEMLIVIVVIGILAAIAYPSYQEHIVKSRARTASSDLMALATDLENSFQRTLSYPVITTDNTSETQAITIGWSPAQADFFVYSVVATSGGYTLTASGTGMMNGCDITLNQANTRTASSQCLIQARW